jgi:hypothetical protein
MKFELYKTYVLMDNKNGDVYTFMKLSKDSGSIFGFIDNGADIGTVCLSKKECDRIFIVGEL